MKALALLAAALILFLLKLILVLIGWNLFMVPVFHLSQLTVLQASGAIFLVNGLFNIKGGVSSKDK